MRELAERAYFVLCLALGWLLRSGRYSKARIVSQHGELQVRKYRLFYAPLLVRMGGPLVRILDTGVRVLPQRDWEERERLVYRSLRGTSIRIDADGTLVLPCLAGETLATLLDNPELEESVRKRAIERAVIVTWTCGGTLQYADDLTGPWFDIPSATSPYCVAATAAKKFYRVRN